MNGGSQTTKPRGKTQSGKQAESSPAPTDASSPPEDGITPRTDSNENENDDNGQDPPSKRRRANSEEPRRSSDTAKSRWTDEDPMEALWRAIQSSPARNLERRNVPAADKDLTPKPVKRTLFPNSHAVSKPLGETSGNSPRRSPRRSPRTASRNAGKQPQGKENQTGAAQGVDLLFENPTFDFDLPVSPTPRRHSKRSPASGSRREGLDTTPTKLTAQKLQRIHGAGTTPRQSKTPRRSHSSFSDLPPLPEAFEGMEPMMTDMFDNDSNVDFLPFDPSKFSSGGEWAGWLTSDAASAVGSDEGHGNGEWASEDFIDAIFSDSAMQKENMQFDPFALGDSNVLDSGFFSSESQNQDMMIVGSKENPSADHAAGQEQE